MIKKNDMLSVRDVQEMLGIPLLGAIPEDSNVIISTNRGKPLVLNKKLTLSGISFENAARRLVGRKEYLVNTQCMDDDSSESKSILRKIQELLTGS
jgi:septum site-determining protein MinD